MGQERISTPEVNETKQGKEPVRNISTIIRTVDLTSNSEDELDDRTRDHIMNITTQDKTEKRDDSIEILEPETISQTTKDSIQMIEPELLAQIIQETQGKPQDRRRSHGREATRPNRMKTTGSKKTKLETGQ